MRKLRYSMPQELRESQDQATFLAYSNFPGNNKLQFPEFLLNFSTGF